MYDDVPALVGNPTLGSLSLALRPPAGALTVSGRPLLNLSFAVNHAISGVEPWSYHVANVVIHVLAGWTLLGILRRTRWGGRGEGSDEAVASTAALLWTVHPLQTEAVTYTVQRAESLMGLCYLFTLYAFIRGVQRGSWRWLAGSVLACLAGVGVKESIATVPLVVFGYDAVFVAGGWRAAWKARRAYYAALAATWVPLAWLVLANGSRGGSAGFDVGVGALHYWLTQGVAVLDYLKRCFWPHPLVFLTAPIVRTTALGPILAAVGVLAGFGVCVAGLCRRKAWGFLGTVGFILLAPTSVIPGTMQQIAEHRMYLPLACVIVAVGAALGRRWAWPLAALAIPLIVVGSRRNRDYASALNLWAATVRDSPQSAQAEASYAAALQASGRPAEAAEHYQRALDLSPPDQRHCDLGLAWEQQGRPDVALEEFQQALSAHPHMGFAELGQGRALAALGRLPEAERALRLGLEDSPRVGTDAAVGHFILGQLLRAQGRSAEADAETAKALAIDPALAKPPASSR